MVEEIKELNEYELQQAHMARKLDNTARILASKKLRQLRMVDNVDNSEAVKEALKRAEAEGGKISLKTPTKDKTDLTVTPKMLEVLQAEIDRLEAKIKPLKEVIQHGKSKNKEHDEKSIKFFSEQLEPKKKELKKLTAMLGAGGKNTPPKNNGKPEPDPPKNPGNPADDNGGKELDDGSKEPSKTNKLPGINGNK
jgi:hypothetical protein